MAFSRTLKILLWSLPTIALLLVADHWLSSDDTGGFRRAYMRNAEKRLATRGNSKVAILGQSTIGQWLGDGTLARALHVPKSTVVDGHIGGCDFACSFAQVRRLLTQKRRFESIFFGANLYQMCEQTRSWRTFMPFHMIPSAQIPELMGIWLHARHPLYFEGRALGMLMSKAYRDPLAAQERLREALAVTPAKDAGWARKPPPAPGWTPSCKYSDEDVGLNSAFAEHLVADLSKLARRVYYVALPDRSTSDPDYRSAWTRFRVHQKQIAASAPHVTFIDLTQGGATAPEHFRDGAHLNGRGDKLQTRLFVKKLEELGVP